MMFPNPDKWKIRGFTRFGINRPLAEADTMGEAIRLANEYRKFGEQIVSFNAEKRTIVVN